MLCNVKEHRFLDQRRQQPIGIWLRVGEAIKLLNLSEQQAHKKGPLCTVVSNEQLSSGPQQAMYGAQDSALHFYGALVQDEARDGLIGPSGFRPGKLVAHRAAPVDNRPCGRCLIPGDGEHIFVWIYRNDMEVGAGLLHHQREASGTAAYVDDGFSRLGVDQLQKLGAPSPLTGHDCDYTVVVIRKLMPPQSRHEVALFNQCSAPVCCRSPSYPFSEVAP